MNNTEDHKFFPVVPRRDRILVLRDFILAKFDVDQIRNGFILDVAGGKGDLSFVLCNADGIKSVVVDPRCPDHDKIARTCQWYHENPVQAVVQAYNGQTLAGLALTPPFQVPQHLRMFFESNLLSALVMGQQNDTEWNIYWEQTNQRIAQIMESGFKPHRQKKTTEADGDCPQQPRKLIGNHVVKSAALAWKIFYSATLVIGFHPDEATDACVDFALSRRLPFCVCPCCVFPSFFPHRQTFDGRSVSTYADYITYLREKHRNIRVERLPFSSSAEGHGAGLVRNTVLYMLPSDYVETT